MELFNRERFTKTNRPTRPELELGFSQMYMRLFSILKDMQELHGRQMLYNMKRNKKIEEKLKKDAEEYDAQFKRTKKHR